MSTHPAESADWLNVLFSQVSHYLALGNIRIVSELQLMFDITDPARVQERPFRYGRGRRGEDASGEVVESWWSEVFFVAGESCTVAPLPSYYVPAPLLT
jgi:hypothetical protein